MMIQYAMYSGMVLLFVCVFLVFNHLFSTFWSYRATRYKLNYVRKSTMAYRITAYVENQNVLYNHLKSLLESVLVKMSVPTFLFVSLLLGCCGVFIGGIFFQSVKGVFMLSVIFTSFPYLLVRTRLLNIRLTTRLEFLPAIEIFYQSYSMNENRNIKNALKTCLHENRISYRIKPVFEQLYRNLMTHQEDESSLHVFTLTVGHVWAQYFTSILAVALHEGVDVSKNLKDLIQDMRKAQRNDQAERNRLLEIRIANFTPCLFLALFLFVNYKVNPDHAYLYYVVDPVGRGLILDALFLIFISFLMGMYLSFRRM